MSAYHKANSRDDLSDTLVHLTNGYTPDNYPLGHFEIIKEIIGSGTILPSERPETTNTSIDPVCCFYDIPSNLYKQIVKTNPNERSFFGIIIDKVIFWKIGGRPAIYTDVITYYDKKSRSQKKQLAIPRTIQINMDRSKQISPRRLDT